MGKFGRSYTSYLLSQYFTINTLSWQAVRCVKFYTYFLQNYRKNMCKVLNCKQKHNKHFCKVCQNIDSQHFSNECPLSSTIYYGTTAKISIKIKEKGFLPSHKGTPQEGIYFWSSFDQAKSEAQKKHPNQQLVVIECKAPTSMVGLPIPKFGNESGEDVIKQTLYQWYMKSKSMGHNLHEPWQVGTQKRLKDGKMIKLVKFHQLKKLQNGSVA